MLEESVYRRKSNENPTLLVGSWIIIVPRKHDNLYRKNRFLVVASIG